MSYNSIIDKYYNLIRKDAEYYRNWLNHHGTECRLLIPKSKSIKSINEVQDAYGAQTFASTPLNYSEKVIHILIQTRDFAKIENGTESTIQAIVPYKLDDGWIIKYRKLDTWFDFCVEHPIESVYKMLYKVTLRLMVPRTENIEDEVFDE